MNHGVRVSIPNSVRKTIQNIKEITGNHSDDEIYAMLKDCAMDPNETAQKLLLQDPFHEVRRKRDRKKEILNKESVEPRWKPGMQGRGNWGGRGSYSSRNVSHDAGSSRNALSAKENEIYQGANDGVVLPAPQDKKNKETIVVSSSSKLDGPLPQLSASDPILMPSKDSRLPVASIRREIGSQRTPVDQVKEAPVEIKTACGPEVGSISTHGSSSVGRPPSNYNNKPQQATGPQKVGPVKEWKPKPTNPIPVIPVEDHSSIKPASIVPDSKDATSEKESHISDVQHVIIPNHLHVPEAEKLGFRFGSFDATFGFDSSGHVSDNSPSLSKASDEITEHIEERATRNEDVLVTADDREDPNRPSSSSNVPENLSAEDDVAPDHSDSKQETSLPMPGHQYPVVHPSSNLSFGFIPPIIGTQIAPFETNEPQARDASHVPSFVVQQPFDPASYYPQFYRSGADSDGRISPFHQPGVGSKYNGNVPVLSQQASQSSQEVVNSIMMSATGPAPLVTQAPGAMQSSIAVTQQPLPVFRQPTGLHLPHYPPNYIPYGPYFSPYYIPPPAIHQFLTNGGFPQPPQAGGLYPAPPVTTPKYPLPQYKLGSNNSGHIGVPGAYGPYGSGYNPNPATTASNSTSNEDLGGPQFKENNVYVTGQQSEGSGVWIAGPGRDISGSFYNLPQAAAHGSFASIYHHHPTQPVTAGPIHPLLQQPQTMAGGVDMVGPTSSMYQQQPTQPAQINWRNNY